jgi:hypothetical protein
MGRGESDMTDVIHAKCQLSPDGPLTALALRFRFLLSSAVLIVKRLHPCVASREPFEPQLRVAN